MSAIKRHVIKPLTAAIRYARLPLASWATLALLPGTVWAGPQGEQVVAGAVAVARPDAHTTRVTQSGDKAIVNWNSFSVGGQEYVQFVQPGSTSAILNRVVGGQASQILGHLNANGRVFLVNPQGVYFGAGAKVDTAGLVASVLDINDQDFMDSRYVFTKGTAAAEAEVRNSGEIHTSQFAVLIGDRVANEGLIEARLGTVALGAGSKVSLSLDQTGLVNFAVDEKTLARHAGVENTGTLLANGGRVLLTAKVADDLLATAVNNTGVIRAQGITEHNGEIILSASGGDVVNRGTLDASGPTGGNVLVSATHDVEIAPTAQVLAEGTGAGHGGSVRLIAEHGLAVRDGARVATRGGEAGGKGGLVELSAHHGGLAVAAHAVTVGSGGRLVIDPARLLIASTGSSISGSYIGKDYIEGQLNLGVSLDLIAASSVGAVAANHVDTASPFTITAAGLGDLHIKLGTVASSSFARGSAGDINLSPVSIDIGGKFEALAGSQTGHVSLGGVTANEINIQAGRLSGATAVATALTAAGGSVEVEGYAIAINGNVRASDNGSVHVQLSPESGGHLSVTGDIRVKSLPSGSSAMARIDLGSYSAAGAASINVTGLIEAEGRQANIGIYANNIQIGAAHALAHGTSGGDAAIRLQGHGTVNVQGVVLSGNETTALLASGDTAARSNALVSVLNGGSVALHGSVRALAQGSQERGAVFLGSSNSPILGELTLDGQVEAAGHLGATININANTVALGAGAVAQATGGSAGITIRSMTPSVSGEGAAMTLIGGVSVTATHRASVSLVNGGTSTDGGFSGSGAMTVGDVSAVGGTSAQIWIKNSGTYGDITVAGNLLAQAAVGRASIQLDHPNPSLASGDIAVTGTLYAVGGNSAYVDINNSEGNVTLGGDITVSGQGGSASLSISGAAVSLKGATVTAEGVTDFSSAGIDISARGGILVDGNLAARQTNPSSSGSGVASISLDNTTTGDITVTGNLLALNSGPGNASISLYNTAAGGGITVSGTLGATGGGDASIYTSAAQGDVTLDGAITVLAQGGSADLYVSGDVVSMKGATVTARGGSNSDASIYIQARNGISVVGNLTAQQLNSADNGSASISLYNINNSSATGNIMVTGNLLALTSGSGRASMYLSNSAAGGGITVTGTLGATGGGDASIDINANQGDVTLGGDITVLGQGGSASLSISGDAVSLKGATVTAQGSSDSSASIDISARNGISVVGNLTALQTNLAGSGSASIYLNNGSATGNITVTGNLLAVASGAGDASIDLYNSAPGGGITVTGTLGATGGDDASIDIHANQGDVTLGGDITVLGQGTFASLSISGVAVSMKSATVTAEGGSASLPGNAGIDILAGSSFGSSSINPGNLTGLLTINGALLADAATGSASISLAGASVTVSAPVTAHAVAVPSTLLVGVSGGALTTLGTGILQADSVTLVGLGSTQSFSVRTNTQHLTLTNEIFGLNAGVLSGVNLYLDNTAYAGPTLVDTNTNIQAFIDPATGTRFADTLITGLAFSSARMLFTGDVGFAGEVAANNMAVDVANGVLVFSGIGIGEVPLSGDLGDAYSLALLAQAAQAAGVSLALPQYNGAPTTGANAIFAARNGITFSDGLTLDDPDVPYVAFLTDGLLDFGPGVLSINPSRQDFLAQFSSYTPGATVHIENVLPSTLDGTGPYFVNDLNFQLLPGTTLLTGGTLTPTGIGLPHPGPVLIGQNGALNIGHQNAFFVANGAITGVGNVISTGFVAVAGTPVPPAPPPAPTPSTPDSLSSGTVAGAVLADAANGDLMLASVSEDDEEDENDPGNLEDAAGDNQSESGLGGKSNTGQMCE